MAMTPEQFDVVVAGGGPAGASAATILAKAGHRVLVLEKERFPRFHVGESLLPAGWELWDRLGVTAAIEHGGFVVKQGANFGMFNQPEQVQLLTAEYPEYFQRPYAYHVERAKFDELLLNNAASSGAEVRQEWTVADVIMKGEQAVGVMAGPNGEPPREIRARVVVDATGRNCLLSRKLGWRKPDPDLNKISHYAHFVGAQRTVNNDPVFPDSVMTDIHTIDGGWIWYIPLSNDIVSVGVVLDAKFAGHLKGPQARFDYAVANCPLVSQWMAGSRQTTEMHTISNISYLNDSFVGDGFVMIGDASMFVDPVFSAGVTIAIRGGIFAADSIHEALKHNDVRAERLRPYEDKIRVPMGRIFKMIRNWYGILEKKDGANNIFTRSRRVPLLRERLIVLLSGGYDKVDLDGILKAAAESEQAAAAN
jgi:FAD-dependent halogenase